MLKLVGDDISSIDAFMRQYRVRLYAVRSTHCSNSFYRWIIPLLCTVCKLVFQLLWSTRAKLDLRLGNGLQRLHRSVHLSLLMYGMLSCLQSFITFMDALKLRLRAKDQLHPILQELVTGYARFKGSKDWEGRSKMVGWCATVSALYLSYSSLSNLQAYHFEWDESIRRNN